MKLFFLSLTMVLNLVCFSQKVVLTKKMEDGRLTLSDDGANYFAKLSLDCANRVYPHFYNEHKIESAADLKTPEQFWPSFYGCYDWHSGVHNHWALVKLLQKYPNNIHAKAIKEKLNKSFDAANIAKEVKYFETHDLSFEYPYGTSWLLKIATELNAWSDADAKKWLANLMPLVNYLNKTYVKVLPNTEEPTFEGNHYSTAFGLSFALDYARSFKKDTLEKIIIKAAKGFYKDVAKFPLVKEPFGYDFMSAGLLITELMRRVYTPLEFDRWIKTFAPDLFTVDGIKESLKVKKLSSHDGYDSHWDGFHLNRIWCLNGLINTCYKSTVTDEIRQKWITAQQEMWDYAQESIGKGNYDIDHWLSSFSVYALEGNK
jgi:Protein of unknown function (DUF2891)